MTVARLFAALVLATLVAGCRTPPTQLVSDTPIVGKQDADPVPPDGRADAAAPFSRPAPIPPLLEPSARHGSAVEYDLRIEQGRTFYFPGVSTRTIGYNGGHLGPTIRLRRGEQVTVRIHNQLDQGEPLGWPETSNIHWHGLRVPAAADGPHHDIVPGETFTAKFPVIQAAGTFWYHPHTVNSSHQVFRGLAGMLLIDDDISENVGLPRTYGLNDLPLIVQDKRFHPDGTFSFMDREHVAQVTSNGVVQLNDRDRMIGDRILVNGVINPYMNVPRSLVRLRLLNASDARRYNFAFSDGRTFYLVASEGGLLPQPVPLTNLMLTPAERAEILVDFGGDREGGRVKLMSRPFKVYREEVGPFVAPYVAKINDQFHRVISPVAMGEDFPVVELRVSKPGIPAALPRTLVPDTPLLEADAERTRQFEFEKTGEMTINGRRFDGKRVDVRVPKNATEIWAIRNYAPEFSHSFHIHGIQFKVLDRTVGGKTQQIPPIERGWKDTVMVYPEETVRVIGRFNDLDGMYMYHCHILMHEDGGMMGTFLMEPGAADATAPNHSH